MLLRRIFPFLEWAGNYQRGYLRSDLSAGLTVAVVLVPQSMAYALLAGLPPIYGLYASLIPIFVYALFGTSRQLSVGPVAITSILILTGVGVLAEPGSAEFIGLAITTALLVGIIQVVFGVFRLGFLVNFLSHPIMMGFTSAAALIIAVSQLKTLLGIEIPRSIYVHEVLIAAVGKVSEISWPTVGIGMAAIAIMVAGRRIHARMPGALIAAVVTTLAVAIFGWDAQGVEVVGAVPHGLPHFEVPSLTWETTSSLLSLALTLTVLQMIESISIAKAVEADRKDHRVDANQELIALGLSKIAGSFFQAYPTTGSFSRTAINHKAGAVTGLSSVIAGILVMLTLLLFTPLFYYLPNAVLAAIIIVAVSGLFQFRAAIRMFHTHRADFFMLIATFGCTLFLGVMPGVITGIILSLLVMIYRTSTPHVCELGRLPGTRHYRNPLRFPEVEIDEDILIVRFDAQLYFGTANYFRDKMEELVIARGDKVRLFILDARSLTALDTSGELALRDLIQFLHERGIRFNLAGATGPLRDSLFNTGLMEKIGEEHQFMLVHDAIQHYRTDADNVDHWSEHALQTNLSNDT